MRSFKSITFFCAAALAAGILSQVALAQSATPPPATPPGPTEPSPANPPPANSPLPSPQPAGGWVAAPGQPVPRVVGDPREAELGHARERVNVIYRNLEIKREKAAYLGVSGSPVVPALREQLKLPAGIGMVVDFVEPKSPADEAGIKQYDVLHKLDDQLLVNAHQLAVLVRTHKPGDEITLTLIRQGESKQIKAKLVEKEVAALDDKNPWGVPPGPWQNTVEADVINYAPVGVMAYPLTDVRGQVHWSDDQSNLLITSSGPGQRRLTARDKEGKILFEGPINNESELKAVPPDVRGKLDKMNALPGGAIMQSTTQPAPTPGFGGGGMIRIRTAPTLESGEKQ